MTSLMQYATPVTEQPGFDFAALVALLIEILIQILSALL